MSEEVVKSRMLEEYVEYWMDKGALEAREEKEYQRLTEDIDKKNQMILDMALPWQRKVVAELIDDIKSMENARSSMEMDSVIKLIYNSKEDRK